MIGLLLLLVVLAVAVVVQLGGWERYRPKPSPRATVPTTEVFVDPETGLVKRVWIDPISGTREYRDDPGSAVPRGLGPGAAPPGGVVPPAPPPPPA